MRDYTVSLLKAWWGAAAGPANDFCFDYLPRLTASHSTYDTVMAQIEGKVAGYFLFGQNPAVGSANTRMQRLGMSKLDWLVIRDFSLIESATWWKDGPEIDSGEMRTEDIGTEVFFFPGRGAHREERHLHEHAAHGPMAPQGGRAGRGPAQRPLVHVSPRSANPRAARRLDRRDGPAGPRPHLGLPDRGSDGRARRRRRPGRDQRLERGGRVPLRLHAAGERWVDLLRVLDLLRQLCGRGQSDGAADARQRAELARSRLGVGVAGQPPHPLQPRIRRPRGAAMERAQGARMVGRRAGMLDRARRPRLRGRQAARVPSGRRRPGAGGDRRRRPVHHAGRRSRLAVRTRGRRGRAAADPLRAAGLPGAQPAAPPAAQPGSPALRAREQPLPPGPGRPRRRACFPSSSRPTG